MGSINQRNPELNVPEKEIPPHELKEMPPEMITEIHQELGLSKPKNPHLAKFNAWCKVNNFHLVDGLIKSIGIK